MSEDSNDNDAGLGVRIPRVEEYVDPTQLKADMAYSLADLSTAMMRQSSMAVHYGVLLAKASRQLDDLELRLELLEAKRFGELRARAIAAGEKTTVDSLKAEVALTPVVIAAKFAVNKAKGVESIAKTAVEGFRQRRDMLIQHGASDREERKGELTTRRREILDEERRATGDRVMERLREGQNQH